METRHGSLWAYTLVVKLYLIKLEIICLTIENQVFGDAELYTCGLCPVDVYFFVDLIIGKVDFKPFTKTLPLLCSTHTHTFCLLLRRCCNIKINFPCPTLICRLQDDFILADPTSDNNTHPIVSRRKPSIIAQTAGASEKLHACTQLPLDADEQGDVSPISSCFVMSTPAHPNTYSLEVFLSFPTVAFFGLSWVNHSGQPLYRQ